MYVVVFGDSARRAHTARGERLDACSAQAEASADVRFLEKPSVVTPRPLASDRWAARAHHAVFDEIERSPRFARRIIAGLSERVESLVKELERQSRAAPRAPGETLRTPAWRGPAWWCCRRQGESLRT